jgi:hypothetical protein
LVRAEISAQRQGTAQNIEETSGLAEKYLAGVFVKNPNNAEANILLAQIYLLKSSTNPRTVLPIYQKLMNILLKQLLMIKTIPELIL